MKKILLLFLLGMFSFQFAYAYSFSYVCETGQTLYFTVVSDEEPYQVSVVPPNDVQPYWNEEPKPQGDLRIPENVYFDGISYSVVSISDCAFFACDELNSVEMSGSIESIGKYSFIECQRIRSVELSSALTFLPEYCFMGCESLVSISIPDGVAHIGSYAFCNCSSLISLSFGASLETIEENAFSYCIGLTVLDFPESLKSIGVSAFYECRGVTAITFPDSLESIASGAFGYCNSLESLFIPSSVTSIDFWNFFDAPQLSSIVVDENNPVYDSRGGCNAIIEKATDKLIIGCKMTQIPNGVVSIGQFSFFQCDELTECVLPSSVKKIERGAFSRCAKLASIQLSNSIEHIAEDAFVYSGLRSVVIPASVTFIGTNPFRGCNDMVSMSVDADNSTFDSREDCNAIIQTSSNAIVSGCKTTLIPNTVVRIGTAAFCECMGITSILIPRSVRSIDNSAFKGCENMVSLTLPSSIVTIKEQAFSYCDNLKTIYARPKKCPATRRSFLGVKATVHVPKGSYNSYSATMGDYGFDYIEEYMIPEGSQWWYELRDKENNLSYQHLDYSKDTLINDIAVKTIVNEHRFADASPIVSHEYLQEDSCRLYWWDRNSEKFTLLYDYMAGPGDAWEIMVDDDSLTVYVDSLSTVTYDDLSYEMAYIHDDEHIYDGPILYGLGHFDSFFPELDLLLEGYVVSGLRCYWIDDDLKMHFGEVDCDSIVFFETPEYVPIADGLSIYPNPASSTITIEAEGMQTVSIYNLLGQLVKSVSSCGASELRLDVSEWASGLYFVEGVDEKGFRRTGRFVK